ncbi:hypothetical protein FXO37_10330 [Capsicum annuum]|nr:hypothetical protein FXO37_10330 [Capsicum annuum]
MVLEVLKDILLSSKGCHVMVIAPTFDQGSLEESRECEKGLKGPLEGACTQSSLEVRPTCSSGLRAGQNSFIRSRNAFEAACLTMLSSQARHNFLVEPKVFGSTCCVRDVRPSVTNLDPKALKCVFLNYTRLQRGIVATLLILAGRGRPKKYEREVIRHDKEQLQLTEDITLDRKNRDQTIIVSPGIGAYPSSWHHLYLESAGTSVVKGKRLVSNGEWRGEGSLCRLFSPWCGENEKATPLQERR